MKKINQDQLMQGKNFVGKKENLCFIFRNSVTPPKCSKVHVKPNICLQISTSSLFLAGLVPHSAYVSLKQACILPDSFFT